MRLLLGLALGATVATAAPVLTTPNRGGAAAAPVSGYRVTDVAYAFAPGSADRVARVSFSLAPPAARTVRVTLGGRTTGCAVRRGRATCRFDGAGPDVAAVGSLTVRAAE
jgi:hypothetical protein